MYSSIEDVIKEYKILRKTLKSACEFNLICKGYKLFLIYFSKDVKLKLESN
jgi:hypothetical protein